MPERTIFECFKKLIEGPSPSHALKQEHRMRVKELGSGISLEDRVFSDLPCLLVGEQRVQKNNVLVFLKKVTTLNDKFRSTALRDSEELIKRLEVMCQTQLHLITVSALETQTYDGL